MDKNPVYDIVFIGHYTRDTIVSSRGTRYVDGGAFNYGAHVAARMGLKTAAITHLAREDWRVVDELESLGVDVFATATPQSTCLKLEYPTANVDERTITLTSTAGQITTDEVARIHSKIFVVGTSIRQEIDPEVLRILSRQGAMLALDVQGFLRVAQDGVLVQQDWPDKTSCLALVQVLKVDAVEARVLTGERDYRAAALALADYGPHEILLTHRDGLMVYAGGEFYSETFFPTALVGRSGRGDTCLSAYVGKRLTDSPANSVIWAAAVASLKMEAEGPFHRDISEVEALVREKYHTEIG